jgi:hypothetical protein
MITDPLLNDISRDSFPHDHDLDLRNFILELLGGAVGARKERFIIRKLFVAVSRSLEAECSHTLNLAQTTALALRLASLPSTEASHWGGWILDCVQTLSIRGAPSDYILEFLEIAAQEVNRADLLGPAKCVSAHSRAFQPLTKVQRARMRQTLLDVVSNVVQLITNVIQSVIVKKREQTSTSHGVVNELSQAVKCMEAWLSILPSR